MTRGAVVWQKLKSALWFLKPVDPEALGLHDYFKETCKEKAADGGITCHKTDNPLLHPGRLASPRAPFPRACFTRAYFPTRSSFVSENFRIDRAKAARAKALIAATEAQLVS